MSLLILLKVVFLDNSRFSMARLPFGTGTRMALEVSFPSKFGNALLTALPAPVSVELEKQFSPYIQLGKKNLEQVEVLEGLEVGDLIVDEGATLVENNQRVKNIQQ